jgi:hypothetical protein
MTIQEYKRAVLDLFRSGRATDEQWQEMAECVLWTSEHGLEFVTAIDAVCCPEEVER